MSTVAVIYQCESCGADLDADQAMEAWARTPLGVKCFRACNGLCAHRAMQAYREQPCKPTSRPRTREERAMEAMASA